MKGNKNIHYLFYFLYHSIICLFDRILHNNDIVNKSSVTPNKLFFNTFYSLPAAFKCLQNCTLKGTLSHTRNITIQIHFKISIQSKNKKICKLKPNFPEKC